MKMDSCIYAVLKRVRLDNTDNNTDNITDNITDNKLIIKLNYKYLEEFKIIVIQFNN